MKKVVILGDCHKENIFNENLNKNLNFDLNIYYRPGLRVVGFTGKLNELKDVFSLMELEKNKYSNSDLIMPWLGHVDILFFLVKHKNAEKVAEYYVKNFIKMFPNKKIRFIEPLPQFIDTHVLTAPQDKFYSFEDRVEQNDLFIKSLRNFSNEFNLMPPINQEKFIPLLDPIIDVRNWNFTNVYNFITEEVKNTIEFYNMEKE